MGVIPGCTISRARTGLPAGEMTCALPGGSSPIGARTTGAIEI
ncbi:MAG TPA: hypothetical protein VHZ03_00065 [Trebonia sp.]|nr:hypothetical protein [Trebonia sp.]